MWEEFRSVWHAIGAVSVLFALIFTAIIAVNILIARPSFQRRRDWRVLDQCGEIDWRRVDADLFLMHYLVQIWKILLIVSSVFIVGLFFHV